MPRLFMAIRQEDRLPVVDILAQTPQPPPGCQWALFLRNHDELTLEMVTEEERLYMYHVYATEPHARLNLGIRRRLAPLLGNHRRRIELMNALLFSLQGIRCHGNLHLGQVLHAGDDLVIIDFDGEPGRPLYERRLKHSPLQDVATMVRSFHYAAHAALRPPRARRGRPHDASRRMHWMRAWQSRVGDVFVDAYARSLTGSGLLPTDMEEARVLFHSYLVERAFYETGFELNRQSAWLRGPLLDLPLLMSAPMDPKD